MHNLLPGPARAVTEPLTIGSHGQRALRFEEIVGDGHAAQDGVFYEVEAEWNMSGPRPTSPLVFAKWGNISINIVMRKRKSVYWRGKQKAASFSFITPVYACVEIHL